MFMPTLARCGRSASPRHSLAPVGKSGSSQQLAKDSAQSRLYRDISPTRVFAAAGVGEGGIRDECRTSLPDLFRQKKGLQSLRPVYTIGADSLAESDDGRTPKLLQR